MEMLLERPKLSRPRKEYPLLNDLPGYEPSYDDHPLHHNWEGSRDCHLAHDFVLLYTLEGEDLLILERLGSHSEIFRL